MRILSNSINKYIGKSISVAGWIHKLRKLGGITFVVLRDREGLLQGIVEKAEANKLLANLSTESVVEMTGKVVKEDRAPGGAELHVDKVKIISIVSEDIPVEINKKGLKANLDTLLDFRQITLRAPLQRSIFKIHSVVTNSFREYLTTNDFVEINTPKIVEEGLETGGAEMFSLKWFNKKAYLSQSPQMYKQIMVGALERVFEISPYFRAEKHNTSRHVNEFTMMDFEIGFIESWEEIMDVSEGYIKTMVTALKEKCLSELEMWNVTLPLVPKQIPRIKLSEAQAIIKKEFKHDIIGEPDLDPEGEKLISRYALEKLKSDFIFITHYPSKKRAFYSMDDPKDPKNTLTFDLLFRGLEINSGGQRMHLYEDYVKKMKSRDLKIEDFTDYLVVFKYGMPAHGGTGWGADRITQRILYLENIREAILFPRDINRLRP